jgi:hypothetical protein
MRRLVAFALVFALCHAAFAACPDGSTPFGGGGPSSSDCFVAFCGTTSKNLSCADGSACDMDGKTDGVCTLPLQACTAVSGLGSCSATTLDTPATAGPASSPTAQQLTSALSALGTAPGCTPPGLTVPLKLSLAGIKPGKAKLTVTATSGGKRDSDRLQLACTPGTSAPSFAQAVQPIFTAKCAYSGCHDPFTKAGGQDLTEGAAYTSDVGAKATLGKLQRVKPGSIKASMLAHRILGQAVPGGGTQMPQGCPGIAPPGCPAGTIADCCLTDAEKFTILSWIASGAPNN